VARLTRSSSTIRPVLYQLGRAGDRFFVGEGPLDLSTAPRPLHFGRREEGSIDVEQQIDDPWMSTLHARIVDGPRGSGRLFIEDCGSRNGILLNGARIERAPLLHGDVVEMGRTLWVLVEDRHGDPPLSAPAEFGGLATWHPRFGSQLLQLAARASSQDHVWVAGPSGSGKGFLARTLHQLSRREGRFVAVDCRARGPRDIDADLFGVGNAPGRLAEAARGTLLLESAEYLSADAQLRLADAVRRRTQPQTRIVATVGAALETLVEQGALKRVLVDALGNVRVDTPALEDRLGDLGILLDEFMARARGAVAIDREACRLLFRHRFTQNVRGFGRVVEAAASLAAEDDRRRKGGMIEVTHLPFCVAGVETLRALLAQANFLAADHDVGQTGKHPRPAWSVSEQPSSPELSSSSSPGPTQHIESGAPPAPMTKSGAPWRRGTVGVGVEAPLPLDPQPPVDAEALVTALRTAHGNVSAAARLLGRPRAQLMRWLRDLNIDPLAYR
jgi:DNA-binding NtrC family response regulator